jgi:transcriptional regulator with XRE-family HTH domain
LKIEEVIGKHIADARDQQGMSQQQLAEKIGEVLGRPWSRQAVWAAEKGRRAFTAAELVAFAVVLGVPVAHLLSPPLTNGDVQLQDGAAIDKTELRAAIDSFRSAIEPDALGPTALLKVRDVANELRKRVGRDMATADDLERFYDRAIRAQGGAELTDEKGED